MCLPARRRSCVRLFFFFLPSSVLFAFVSSLFATVCIWIRISHHSTLCLFEMMAFCCSCRGTGFLSAHGHFTFFAADNAATVQRWSLALLSF